MNPFWKVCILVSLAVAFVGIWRNGASIDQVCATVQAQHDRNAATVRRGIDGLLAIRDNKPGGERVPGYDYYRARPNELRQAIVRSWRELQTYKGNVC